MSQLDLGFLIGWSGATIGAIIGQLVAHWIMNRRRPWKRWKWEE